MSAKPLYGNGFVKSFGGMSEAPGMMTGVTPVSLQVMAGGKWLTTSSGISASEAGIGGAVPANRAGSNPPSKSVRRELVSRGPWGR